MKLQHFFKLISAISVSLLAGVVGSVFTTQAIPTWYASLNKPMLNPPSWLFGPVWTLLYILMGVALYLVWRKNFVAGEHLAKNKTWNKWSRRLWTGDWQNINTMAIFAIQLALNAFWSYVFFGLRSPLGGLVVIVMLWFAIIFTIINFYRISKLSGWLLLPYLLWVSFATYLNFTIWQLN